jgi:hypothetical protein
MRNVNLTSVGMKKNRQSPFARRNGPPASEEPIQTDSCLPGMNSPDHQPLGSGRLAGLQGLATILAEANHALNVTLLYGDAETQRWAADAFEEVAKLAVGHEIRPMWWNLDNLSAPGVLAGAVSTAIRADVIVVATRATEGMPLPFYVWVSGWLSHRPQGAGALIALLGVPETPSRHPGRVGQYLRAVAQQGRLVHFVQNHTSRKSDQPGHYSHAVYAAG